MMLMAQPPTRSRRAVRPVPPAPPPTRPPILSVLFLLFVLAAIGVCAAAALTAMPKRPPGIFRGVGASDESPVPHRTSRIRTTSPLTGIRDS